MPPVVEGALRRFKHGFARIVHFPLENMRVESMLPVLSKKKPRPIPNQQPTTFFPCLSTEASKAPAQLPRKETSSSALKRVELLKKRGQFKAGDKVIGLRKTKPDA